MIAIRRHPVLYAKFVWVGMVEFYEGVGYKFDIESSIAYRKRGNPLSKMGGSHPDEMASRLAAVANGAASASALQDEDTEGGQERFVRGLQHLWQRVHGAIFQNVAWSFAYFIVCALSVFRLARSKGHDTSVFLLFVLTLIPMGASLITSLVVISADRNSYPTQFIYYLSVALSPLLFGSVPGVASRDRVGRPQPPDSDVS